MYVYIYKYIHIQLYLSKATCLVRPHVSVVCVFFLYSVNTHYNSVHHSQLLKNTCVRQAALDKWSPIDARHRTRSCDVRPSCTDFC